MQENETNVEENNEEINEEITSADEVQDEEVQTEDKVTLTKAEYEELKASEEKAQVAEEKATRYKSERDRIKGKAKAESADNGLLEKAFLNSAGYSNPEEQEQIQTMAKNMGITVDSAVNDEFVKSRIESLRAQKQVADATPAGSKRKSSTKDDVQYWLDKGELPPKDMTQLRRDVVNARYKNTKTTNKFNN